MERNNSHGCCRECQISSANLIATGSIVQPTAYIERVMDPELSLPACQMADNSAMWMLENLLDLPGTAE